MLLRRQNHLLLLLCSILCFYPAVYAGAEARFHPRGNSTAPAGGVQAVRGWVPQPNGRGSLDIVISCLSTIFLCSWYCVCPNVAAEGDTLWDNLRDKLSMCLLCALGPEFILYTSMGQWHSARQSIEQFHSTGHSEWTITHAFFADMGGFVLESPDFVPFPVDAKQLHYLVTKGHVDFPTVTEAAIADKNKVNMLARLIALGQALWFLVNCIARAAQRIGLSLGELTTLSFIFCTMATSYYWRRKPADVECPIVLQTNTTIADILLEAGDAARQPYRNTPLDFVDRQEWTVSRHWLYWKKILIEMRIEPIFFRSMRTRPLRRIPEDKFQLVSGHMAYVYCSLTLVYLAVSLIAWNFHFPTPAERFLWRLFTVLQMCVSIFALIGILYLELVLPNLKKRRAEPDPERVELDQPGSHRFAKLHLERVRNFGGGYDEALRIELKELIPFTILATTYAISRYFIILEDCISLRALPRDIFKTVDWSNLLPHF
ncbi:MAG: hypothetical protein M1813_007743 [Trichoglossum hirsutum]|nr:MAG: hypothetical protein M1813_007743 [Trichoglossum hirsutum]